MTSELTDTLLGLRWPLPRTDNDARAALDQLAQVSGRLTALAADQQAAAPAWLGQVQALIAQGGFTLDWWQPLLAEPDLDWTINHQAHLSADLAQIAAAGARILDTLTPSDSAIPPPPVAKSVASFGSVPLGSATAIPPVVPSAPPRSHPAPAPTGAPLLSSGVPGLAQRPLGKPGPGQSSGPGQPGPGQPGRSAPAERQPAQSPGAEPDPLADPGRHRRAAYEFGPARSTWRSAVQDRFPSHVQPYSDDDDDDDPMLSSDRRLPAHSGMILQATVVLCVVGALSWWAVTALHRPPAVPVAAGAPSSQPAAQPTSAAAGLDPSTPTTAPARTTPTTQPATAAAPPVIQPGSATISDLKVLLEGGSEAVQQVDAYVTFNASSTAAVTLTIQYYGVADGTKTAVQTALFPESGQTSYQVPVVISSSAYCGKTITVIATAGTGTAQSTTQPGC